MDKEAGHKITHYVNEVISIADPGTTDLCHQKPEDGLYILGRAVTRTKNDREAS